MPTDLSRSGFVILLSLSNRPRHGLGVVEDVESRTGGMVKLGPGTLYGTLRRLDELGLVHELEQAPVDLSDDPRRKYYEVTEQGRTALEEEAERLRRLVELASTRGVLGRRAEGGA